MANSQDNFENSVTQQAEIVQDNLDDFTTQHTEKIDFEQKFSIEDLQKRYSIGRQPLYSRMKYLRMTTYKVSGRAYLTAGQVAHMDGLHNHIKATGRMEGYPVPEPTGPIEDGSCSTWEDPKTALPPKTAQPENEAALIVAEPQTALPQVAEPKKVTKVTPNYRPTQERTQSHNDVDEIAAVVQSAQNKAVGTLIAENLLARHFIENPDLLPEELKAKIKESGEMPTIDPFAYANSLIDLAHLPGLVA